MNATFARAITGACAALVLTAGCKPKDGAKGIMADRRVAIDAPVPAYAAVTIDGDSVSLAAQRGTVTLLNVWATWCLPCRTEIPALRAIHAKYQARGLQLVGVSIDSDGNDANVRDFMREFEMNFPVWRDVDDRVSNTFLLVGVPATFLIDREGVLRWRMLGPIALGDTSLTAAIERALGS